MEARRKPTLPCTHSGSDAAFDRWRGRQIGDDEQQGGVLVGPADALHRPLRKDPSSRGDRTASMGAQEIGTVHLLLGLVCEKDVAVRGEGRPELQFSKHRHLRQGGGANVEHRSMMPSSLPEPTIRGTGRSAVVPVRSRRSTTAIADLTASTAEGGRTLRGPSPSEDALHSSGQRGHGVIMLVLAGVLRHGALLRLAPPVAAELSIAAGGRENQCRRACTADGASFSSL